MYGIYCTEARGRKFGGRGSSVEHNITHCMHALWKERLMYVIYIIITVSTRSTCTYYIIV